MSTFISQRTNHRTDEFGGCFENRMRLPRLIIENIRRKTGGNLPILCRINASDEVEGGQSVQDAAAVAAYLEQECGVDALHVTRAVHLHDEFMWAPGMSRPAEAGMALAAFREKPVRAALPSGPACCSWMETLAP